MKKNWKLQQFDCLISWKEIYCLWWLQLWLILVWVFFVPFPILDLCWAYLSWRVRLLFFVCAALCFRRKWLTDSKNYKCVSLFWLWLLVIWFWLCLSTIFPISRVSEPTQIFGVDTNVRATECLGRRIFKFEGRKSGTTRTPNTNNTMLFIRRCESWQDFLVSFFGQGEELLLFIPPAFPVWNTAVCITHWGCLFGSCDQRARPTTSNGLPLWCRGTGISS